MPLALARYDLVLRTADDAPPVPVVVDMLETRDADREGKPGRLRAARMKRYDAPGHAVHYMYLQLERNGPGRWVLCLDDVPQRGIEWDRRWIHWLADLE